MNLTVKMKFGKKAMMFEFVMFFMILILLTTAFITLYKKQNKFPEGYWIGERQFGLINIYQNSEKALFYIDQSAKYSAYKTIYDLGQKGGYETSDCGEYFGYKLWNNFDDKENLIECYPKTEEIEEIFKLIFKKNLDEYIKEHNKISFVTVPLDNYIVIIDNLQILGKAIRDIEIPIITKEQIELEITQQREIENIERSYTKDIGEGFVAIKDVSCAGSCILKKEAYDRLLEADKIAKESGFELHVYSTFRSLEYQKALWDGRTPENYAQKYPNPEERKKYVCDPYGPNPYQRCPHLTGKTIDVRIKGKTKNQMINYDWERLANALYEAGWVRYPPEEWHFEYSTERWARAQEAQVYEIV